MANVITLARFPLLLLWVAILYFGSAPLRLLGLGLLLTGLLLDTVDGIVARRRGEASLLGSVLDIAADRAYELVVWLCFAGLGLIPVAVPVIVVVRTTLTDAFRSAGVAEGVAPFAQLRSPVARFLVGSAWMRTGYSASKVIAFAGLALIEALPEFPAGALPWGLTGSAAAARLLGPVLAVVWFAVALCVVRGLPVLFLTVPKGQPTR